MEGRASTRLLLWPQCVHEQVTWNVGRLLVFECLRCFLRARFGFRAPQGLKWGKVELAPPGNFLSQFSG